jgi:hypothetical protein
VVVGVEHGLKNTSAINLDHVQTENRIWLFNQQNQNTYFYSKMQYTKFSEKINNSLTSPSLAPMRQQLEPNACWDHMAWKPSENVTRL